MARRKVTEDNPSERKSSLMFAGGIIGTGILVMGVAVLIGRSDSGQINVASTIQESNAQSEDGGTQVNSVPQAFQNMPNGGLVPQENQTNTTPPPESPATTTDETASTTLQDGDAETLEADVESSGT